MLRFFDWLLTVDRRWIFLGMGMSILLPMLIPFSLPFRVGKPVQDLYDGIERLNPGDKVYMSLDFDPASRPELQPFMEAVLRHLYSKDVRVVAGTLWDYAPGLVVPILEEESAQAGKVRGVDWTFLGFLDGRELAIKALGENLRQAYPKDFWGTPIDAIPIMDNVHRVKDLEMVISISAGFPGTREWVLQVQAQYGLEMASATTAVSTPDYIPYYKAGQLFGLSGGMPGSAQYEKLMGVIGPASSNLNALSIGHLFIILAIVLGNVAMFLTGGARKEEQP